jgi:hypothetical protein
MASKRLLIASWVMLVIVTGASGEAAHEGLVDPAKLAATLDLTEGGVRRWLDRLGVSGDGPPTERLLAVSLTGQPLMERHGASSLVHVDAELDSELRQPGMAVVLVHNHPANAGLSAADTQQLAKPGVAAIVAVGHDGSVFIASAGPRLNRDVFEVRQYALAQAEVRKRLRGEWPSGRVSVAVSDAHFSHLVTLALAKANIVQYGFSLRGTGRESYEGARIVFSQVVVGAAAQLKRKG